MANAKTQSKNIRPGQALDWFLIKIGYVPYIDKVLFTKHLSVMVRAGLPIDESLRILREQATSPTMKRVIRILINVVEGGAPLSDGLGFFPRVFSDLYVNVVRAGERSGNLQKNLDDLAIQTSKTYELKSKIRSAMAYPILVLGASGVVGLGLALFVLPKILKLFKSFHVKLPRSTVVLMWLADKFDKHGLLIAIGVVLAVIALSWLLRRKWIKPYL
ncbi:type II secretion system F family protein, partial [Candidatus Uhrbacteria bacterium]|nr:type II secretion system F family protein [Candidatus Uhrbacteria bacterium]